MSEHPTNFAAAAGVNPHELAERWADVDRWLPKDKDSVLEELATTTALRSWLTRWLPIQIHRALMTGSAVAEVCAAANLTVDEVSTAWYRWASVQRELVIRDRAGLSEADYDRVAAILAGAR